MKQVKNRKVIKEIKIKHFCKQRFNLGLNKITFESKQSNNLHCAQHFTLKFKIR